MLFDSTYHLKSICKNVERKDDIKKGYRYLLEVVVEVRTLCEQYQYNVQKNQGRSFSSYYLRL